MNVGGSIVRQGKRQPAQAGRGGEQQAWGSWDKHFLFGCAFDWQQRGCVGGAPIEPKAASCSSCASWALRTRARRRDSTMVGSRSSSLEAVRGVSNPVCLLFEGVHACGVWKSMGDA